MNFGALHYPMLISDSELMREDMLCITNTCMYPKPISLCLAFKAKPPMTSSKLGFWGEAPNFAHFMTQCQYWLFLDWNFEILTYQFWVRFRQFHHFMHDLCILYRLILGGLSELDASTLCTCKLDGSFLHWSYRVCEHAHMRGPLQKGHLTRRARVVTQPDKESASLP